MASRAEPFVTGEYYHIFNRGVAKQPIFVSNSDYVQAKLTLGFYQYTKPPLRLSRYKRLSFKRKENLEFQQAKSKLVEINCFVFMPNHFHLLLKQLADGGISKFVGQFCNSYTRYFNTRHTRVGHVFQGAFKSVSVESQEQLIHLSRYIHLNPYVSSMVKKEQLANYAWSSYPNYLKGESPIVETSLVLSSFKSSFDYQQFVLNHADYAREIERIKHLTLDTE